jgi:hypothetical protein
MQLQLHNDRGDVDDGLLLDMVGEYSVCVLGLLVNTRKLKTARLFVLGAFSYWLDRLICKTLGDDFFCDGL